MTDSSQRSAKLTPRPPGPLKALRRLLARGETIRLLVGAQLKAGHRDKVLGHFWSLLDPLVTLAVYYLIFGIGFRQAGDRPSEFVLYLFLGIIVWRFFGESVSQATGSLRSHRGLIVAADFPKSVIPISICLARLYDLLWALLVVFMVAWFSGISFSAALLWMPCIIAVELVLTLGVCLFVAYLGLFFADSTNIVSAILRLWVLASPIFYFAHSEHGRTGIIPADLIGYYMLNPIAGLLDAYRAVLIWGEPPAFGEFGYVAVVASISLVVGFVLFTRGEGRFAKYV